MTDIVKVVNEGIGIHEDVPVITSLIFEFYDRLYIGGSIADNNEVTFIRDTDPKYITGFVIKVTNPTERKVHNSVKSGNMIINYLSAKTGFVVRSKRPKIVKDFGNRRQSTVSFSTDALIVKDFDLDASKVSVLFTKKYSINKRIAGYQSGIAALKDNDLERAVQGFYQVIENSQLKEEGEFKPLRHACSHQRIDGKDTAKGIRSFGITCRRHRPVDFTDPDNWAQLHFHTVRLREIAYKHINRLLAKLNI